jgi:hypothetical protein
MRRDSGLTAAECAMGFAARNPEGTSSRLATRRMLPPAIGLLHTRNLDVFSMRARSRDLGSFGRMTRHSEIDAALRTSFRQAAVTRRLRQWSIRQFIWTSCRGCAARQPHKLCGCPEVRNLRGIGQSCLMPHSFPKGEMPAEIKWGRPPGLRGTPSSRSFCGCGCLGARRGRPGGRPRTWASAPLFA